MLLRDAVRVTGERVRRAHFVILPLTAIVAAALWGDLDPIRLLAPLIAANLVAVRGMLIGREFDRADFSDAAEVARFARKYTVGIALYGGVFGLTGACLFVPGDPSAQLPVLMLVCGVAAASLNTQLSFPRGMQAFQVLIFVPLLARILADATRSSLAVAATVAVFWAALALVGRAGARAFHELALLRVEKIQLADQLAAARDELVAESEVLDGRVREVSARLAQSNQMASLGQLAAGVAHEINNPLTWILSNAAYVRETLAEHELPDDAGADLDDALSDILGGARRIDGLVKDMQSLARDTESLRTVDVAALINRCVKIIRKSISPIEIKLALGEPGEIVGNPTRLSQVMLNLLLNAAESTRRAESRGDIEVRCRERDDGALEIEVADHGAGIEVEPVDRVFEPFFTTKGSGEGPGLGLSICRNIVQDHGGSIAVSSRADGATVTIVLPRDGG